jgi:hypothetical protein
MKKIVLLFLILSGCGSAVKKPTKSEIEPDRVISRIDELSSRPEWVKESEPFRIEKGQVISTGMTTISGSDRVEAAYRIAQNNAKAAIAGAIEQKLEFILQNAEEGTSINSNQVRYIGAEASNLVTSSIRPGKNYWEKIATSQDSGDRVTQYKVFSTVVMPEEDFKRAIFDAIKKAQGKGGISKDFAKKVDQQWDKFVENIPAKENN